MIQRIARLVVLCVVTVPGALFAQAAGDAAVDWSRTVVFDAAAFPSVRALFDDEAVPEGAAVLAAEGAAEKPAERARAAGVRVLDVLSHDADAPLNGTDLLSFGMETDEDLDDLFTAASSVPPRLFRIPEAGVAPDVLRHLMLLPNGLLLDAVPEDDVALAILRFRLRHPAVGAGTHERIVNDAYAFHRALGNDHVIIVLGASEAANVNVSRAYADDALLRDALTGRTALVSFGLARFEVHESGLLLLEEVR